MKIVWAKDAWVGWDKLDHVTYGALFWMLLGLGVKFAFYGVFFQLVLFALGCLLLEAIQYVRYEAWQRDMHEYDVARSEVGHAGMEGPPGRPAQADLPSYKDLVADAIGAVLGSFLLYLLQ